MFIPRLCCMVALAALVTAASAANADSIATTPHNLSATGPGTTRAEDEPEVCVFCHTPHNPVPSTPLWNRELSNTVYGVYSSSTLAASPGQPTGASKLCLSCHDGTVAVGSLRSRATPVAMLGAAGAIPSGKANLGTDLSDDHPVSFVYDSGIATRASVIDPAGLPLQIQLDDNGELQCMACHDPHSNRHGSFLVMGNNRSALCLACHRIDGWTQSSHATSNATWNGGGLDPWPNSTLATVADNACGNCHETHGAGRPARLLRREKDEDNCLACHDGSAAAGNIAGLLTSASAHDVRRFVNIHDPVEDPATASQHVQCSDCHNGHAADAQSASAPFVTGAMSEVSGVSSNGTSIAQAGYEYEVCYKCHADNPDRVPSSITRQITQSNARLEFDVGAVSFHPVEIQGRNGDVPSLISPRNTTDIIYCSDCHNSPSGSTAGGIGPDGPHGSPYAPILIAQYTTADGTAESPQAYALCYRCHSRDSILSDESFEVHKKHIEEKQTPCSVCHDAHGISSAQGSDTANSNLINFDTSVVMPDPGTGRLEFRDTGARRGECFLLCHGYEHSPKSYD